MWLALLVQLEPVLLVPLEREQPVLPLVQERLEQHLLRV
jgi:hypothetical protein